MPNIVCTLILGFKSLSGALLFSLRSLGVTGACSHAGQAFRCSDCTSLDGLFTSRIKFGISPSKMHLPQVREKKNKDHIPIGRVAMLQTGKQ